MTQEAQQFWKGHQEKAKELGGGGGGVIGRARVETGYKVFAGGVSQLESWFPALYSDTKGVKAAKAAADKLAKDHPKEDGSPAGVNWGVAIICPTKSSYVKTEKATWQTDAMVRFAASYTDAHNEVMVPSFVTHGIVVPFDGWVRVGVKPDPYAVKNDRKDEEGRYELCHYIVEVFANRGAAMKAVKAMPKGDAKSDVPEGYSAEDWETVKAEIKAQLSGDHPEEDIAGLAEEYDVPAEYIQAISDDIVPV
jgi:hypothetical protein